MAPTAIVSTTTSTAAAADPMALQTPRPAVSREPEPTKTPKAGHDYKGFVAGVFSGMAKLTGTRRLLHTTVP